MSKREPELELLLDGGDLLQLTRLDYHALRDAMRARLHDRIPRLTQRDLDEPALALIDALAACLDVMGFYHDRIVTESKLGSALRLQSVARLGAAIGYRPLPPIAATATQHFVAAANATLVARTRVGSADAVFATTRALEIAPAVNRMALSPVITLHTGARRVVIERLDTAPARRSLKLFSGVAAEQKHASTSLPSDELRRGVVAMLNSDHGLELCTIAGSRRRGVALERPLLRSYDEGTTLARTTRVRHLRYGQPLDESLVVFEVSELPILHLPDPAAPEKLTSTLEVFVFDEPPPSPEQWDAKAAWTEVPDFSASKASDRHYRTFVDDRLMTYVILRRQLGYRTLIEDTQLKQVYARYTPAIGRVLEPPSPPSTALWNLDEVTLRLDRDYLTTSLVRPRLDGVVGLRNEAAWAVTRDEMGLGAGAQIAILGGASGRAYYRTLRDVAERYLAWSDGHVEPPRSGRPANEHDPIDDFFDPAKGKIAPLAVVAAGQHYPLWEAYYKQAREPEQHWTASPPELTGIPPHPYSTRKLTSELARVQVLRYLHKGSTFLLLDDASHVKAGDYLLLGRRLRRPFQNRKGEQDEAKDSSAAEAAPKANDKAPDDKDLFDTSQPWLTAEVTQALEVQGDLVRLKDPIAQDYYLDRLPSGDPITELVVVPRVTSVYYGDLFSQTVKLTSERTFIKINPSLSSNYIEVALDDPIDPVAFREELALTDELSPSTKFSRLFLAIEGKLADPPAIPAPLAWSFLLTLPARGLAPDQVAGIRIGVTELAVAESPVPTTDGIAIAISQVSDAIAANNHPETLMLHVSEDQAAFAWTERVHTSGLLTGGQFRVAEESGWYLKPEDLVSHEDLLRGGGDLLLWDGGTQPKRFSFSWTPRPPMLRLENAPLPPQRPVNDVALDAVAIPLSHTLEVSDLSWTADWRLPDAVFPEAARWMSSSEGMLEIHYDHSSREIEFAVVDAAPGKRIELVSAAVQRPLDPLDGASRLWALPTRDIVAITGEKITAIWRYPVPDSVEQAAPAGWSGPLVVIGPDKILHTATLEGGHSAHRLTARLDGDVTHDLEGTFDVHALVPHDEPSTVTRVSIWEWSGSSPFAGASVHAAALTFAHGPSVAFLAEIWQLAATLWLIPRGATTSETEVTSIVAYHPTAVTAQTRTPEGSDTRIVFTLPADWPTNERIATVDKVVTQKAGLDSHVLDLVDKPTEAGPGTGSFHMKVTGDVADEAVAIYLVLRAASGGSVSSKAALHIVQPAWDSWVHGATPALYFMPSPIAGDAVSSLPAGSVLVDDVIAAKRSDGLWFVRSSTKGFPAHANLYLSPYTARDVTVRPATALKLGPLPDVRERIGALGIRVGDTWDAYSVTADQLTPGGDVELPRAAPRIFAGGIGPSTAARFAYEVAEYDGTPASTGLRLHATQASAAANARGANTAVFHGPGFARAARAALSLDAPNMRVDLDIDPGAVFHADASSRFSLASFGAGWRELRPDRLLEGSLILELGRSAASRLDLDAGDELTLFDADDHGRTTRILHVVDTGYQLAVQGAPSSIRLHGLAAPMRELRIKGSFARPAVSQEPWLLTFHGPGDAIASGKGIDSTLVFHDLIEHTPDDRLSFTLVGTDALDEIAAGRRLRYYTNEASQLHQGLYAGPQVGLSGSNNLLRSNGPAKVEVLFAAANATAFPRGTGPGRRVLLCSTQPIEPLARGKGYVARRAGDRTSRDVRIPVRSESIVFPSGDFIPVTGTLQDRDDKIIRNALRVWLLEDGEDSQLVTYEPRLSKIVELFDADLPWDDICNRIALDKPLIEGFDTATVKTNPNILLYSFNKALGGAFTLNFLLINATLLDHEQQEVRVYVEYSATRRSSDSDPDGRIYQFETGLRRLDPRTQLVVVDKGELKPDEDLFLHVAQQDVIPWTRIVSVTGVVIQVHPPLPFVLDDFRSYTLRGFTRPARPTALDKDYYAQVKDADLTGGTDPRVPAPLVLGDRLVLDPDAGGELLAAIIPGDRLLIWDEAWRVAWHDHRVHGGDEETWKAWPDYQHEAVVKQVDAATGLIVLTEPLPERFRVAFSIQSSLARTEGCAPWDTLEPGELGLRVLPHHRAPFQGERRMITLGSGDRTRRFARFTGELAPDAGLGTVPLAAASAYASNIEVLARDPRSGEWSRWTQFDDLEHATKKDRAFTLGVDASRIGTGAAVPFSASFGDGDAHGQLLPTGTRNVLARVTAIGGRETHVAGRRPLVILAAQAGRKVPFDVPPCANVASTNLWLLVETGAAEEWSPASGRALYTGSSQEAQTRKLAWPPAMSIDAPQGGAGRRWRELSRDEIFLGLDGFYVQGVQDGARPGVVEVFFFTPEPLARDLENTRAWERPDARQWVLDAAFYAELATQDLTRSPGAKRMQLLETDSLGPGSLLALSQGPDGPSEILRLEAVDPETWSATLREPLERVYALDHAFLRGNLVEVVEGDAERVVLGSGDGASLDMRLAVFTRKPLLHVRQDGRTDPEPAIQVLVDDVEWRRVAELEREGPRARVYRLDVEADGRAFVAFGDGVHGAVPGAGTSNIVALARTGNRAQTEGPAAGNASVGAVSKLLDGNLAVKSTSNLTEGVGGRRGDNANEAREALLHRSLGFDRIVSLEDISRVAREVGEVRHAYAEPIAPGSAGRLDPSSSARVLRLVVALVGRRKPSDTILAEIHKRVAALMPATAGMTLQVHAARQVPVHLVIEVTTEGTDQSEVLAALRRAFGTSAGGFFAEERCAIAQPLRLGDVYEAVFAVRGVSSARVTWMSTTKPRSAPGPAPDDIDPGPDGVLRCDGDSVRDPDGDNGTITFSLTSGGSR